MCIIGCKITGSQGFIIGEIRETGGGQQVTPGWVQVRVKLQRDIMKKRSRGKVSKEQSR